MTGSVLPRPPPPTRFSHATQRISQLVHFTPDVDLLQFVAQRCKVHCHFFGNFFDSLRSGAKPDHPEPDPQSVADQQYSPTNFSGHKMANSQQHHERFPTLLDERFPPAECPTAPHLLQFIWSQRTPQVGSIAPTQQAASPTCCAGVQLQNKPVKQTIDQVEMPDQDLLMLPVELS